MPAYSLFDVQHDMSDCLGKFGLALQLRAL